jgi:hypothetical protein
MRSGLSNCASRGRLLADVATGARIVQLIAGLGI